MSRGLNLCGVNGRPHQIRCFGDGVKDFERLGRYEVRVCQRFRAQTERLKLGNLAGHALTRSSVNSSGAVFHAGGVYVVDVHAVLVPNPPSKRNGQALK
jgi:hypothetical protein